MQHPSGQSYNRPSLWQRAKGQLPSRSGQAAKDAMTYGTPMASAFGICLMFMDSMASNEAVNHTPSMMPSYAIGFGSSLLLASLSDSLRKRGHERLASATEKSSKVIACLGSAAYQMAAESGHLYAGTGDPGDFALGLLATGPGIWMAQKIRETTLDVNIIYEAEQICVEASTGIEA